MVGYRHMTTRFPIAGTAVLRLTRTITVRDREDSENVVAAAAVAALWASSRTGGTNRHPRVYRRAGHRRSTWRRRTDRRGPGVVRPEPSPANGEASSSSVPEEDDTVQSSLTHAPESRSWVAGHE